MPKKGEMGVLLWCSLTKAELTRLDQHISGHNSILSRLRGRSFSRSRFLSELLTDSLLEWAWPGGELQPQGETVRVRVRLRLNWGAAEEFKGRCDAENGRRERAGWPPATYQDVAGALVRRFLHTQERQRVTQEPTPSAEFGTSGSPPAPALAAAPFLTERVRVWQAWTKMIAEEIAWRHLGAEFDAMSADPVALWLAKHDVIRDAIGVFSVPKGANPNVLQRVGLVTWTARRVRAAGYRR